MWDVEDLKKVSKGRFIKQTLDICSNEQFIPLPLSSYNIIGLKVFGTTIKKELPFVEYEDRIEVNIGPLNQWFSSGNPKIKHVQLQVEFVNSDFEINENWKGHYEGAIELIGPTRPEFYITPPLGMKLDREGKTVKIFLFKMKEKELLGFNRYKSLGPIAIQTHGKRKYHFKFKNEDYKEIKEEFKIASKPSSNYNTSLVVLYEMVIDDKFFTIPIFGFILFLIPIVKLLYPSFIENFDISYGLILVAFSTITLTLSTQDYIIPYRDYVELFIIMASIEFGIVFVIPESNLLSISIEVSLLLIGLLLILSSLILRKIKSNNDEDNKKKNES